MCGIAAVLRLDGGAPDEAALRAMTRALAHRGPDGEGFARLGPAALGHRRLSIIDLATGAQPMFNEDGSVAIVFNGEIYNHRELRAELEGKGHRFATDHSDTEAIVHLYEEEGVDCVRRLAGMFALAIWDAKRRRLFCARDRMGQKPLYYAVAGSGADAELIVASELSALMGHPHVSRRVDPKALSAYLAFEYVPSPMAIIEGAAKLEAGHFFAVELDRPPRATAEVAQRRYWDVSFARTPVDEQKTEAEWAAELRAELRRAVERRLIADVPLGVFLSGGIDSSAIVASMAELREARDIKTFTIGFEEPTFDESQWARVVARRFGTEHHEERLPALRALEILPEALERMDEPFADPSLLPTHLLCRHTRKHVTVALGGDGGDELFAGYDPFQAHAAGNALARLPRWVRGAMRGAASMIPTSHKNISLDFRIKRFLGGLDYPPARRHFAWLGSFPPPIQRELLTPEALLRIEPEEAFAAADRHWAQCGSADDLERTLYQYLKLYLQDGILPKMDRASMAYGLEARAPMMDHEFVEWAARVPSRLKLRGMTKKYLFKKAMEGVLPREIVWRRKKGFGMPIGEWLRGPLRSFMEDRLSPRSLESAGWIRPDAARRLMDEHLSNRRDRRKEIWTLLCLVEWLRRFGA